jgi:osmoprotectant transport system permease protein
MTGFLRRPIVLLALVLALALGFWGVFLLVRGDESKPKVTVGSKTFTESVILGDMAQQLLEDAGVPAKHVRQLGGTRVVWEALRGGEIDAYPEYTGSIRAEILTGQSFPTDAEMRAALEKQGVRMSKPLGFSNPYALGMKKEVADRLGITKISDLVNHPELRFGFTNEFMKRKDGWPSLQRTYSLPQTQVTGLEHALAYEALNQGSLDLTDLYATDGEIRKFNLKVLEDDRHVFPAYEAVLLYRADLESRSPEALKALLKMENLISNDEMVAMNARVADKKNPVTEGRAAADFLTYKLGIVPVVRGENPWAELLTNAANHMFLVAVSLLAAIIIAVPLGVLAARQPVIGQAILASTGILQTVPSLALLVFMVWLLHGRIGAVPAIIALFLYSLLPIVRNTYTGLKDIPIQSRESAEALGLPAGVRLRLIELPLASRSILAGIKTAAVINVGNATLGGLIGAGGFGQPIIEALRRNDMTQLLLQGILPAVGLALLVQGVFELAERGLVPRGLRLKVEG